MGHGRNWTQEELLFLELNARSGARFVASRLGRSVKAVENKASRHGLFLGSVFVCPGCGGFSRSPLSPTTGFCRVCSLKQRKREQAAQLEALRREEERVKEEARQLQNIYQQKSKCRRRIAKAAKARALKRDGR